MLATLKLPSIKDQHAFNLKRWEAVSADPELAALEYRIETDRFGKIIMSPPPGFDHSGFQSEVLLALGRLLPHGKTLVECPISTADGVKGADAAWISQARRARAVKNNVLVIAPEICMEVLWNSNTRQEMSVKKRSTSRPARMRSGSATGRAGCFSISRTSRKRRWPPPSFARRSPGRWGEPIL